MNILDLRTVYSTRQAPPLTRLARLTTTASAATFGLLAVASSALAQVGGTGPGNGIGAQLQSIAGETSNAGGYIGSSAMYVGAIVIFLGAAWALWKSRQPQNRESGYVAMGLAGLVLCGLFATGGAWIGKSSQTATGSAASVTSTPSLVTFN